jgi:hypothetical protein
LVPAGSAPVGDVRVGDVPSPRAQVLVTVPVFSLLGQTEEPALLDGYGPIPPSMARRLVADGATSFLRVLTDPRDGAPLEIGRTSYRLTKPMRQWLHLRDARCTFPNCNNHSLDNDADHILAWADGGGTGITNLGQPCPKHHRLKHTTAWRPVGASRESPPGWISPAGRHYPSEHQDWEPPTWPDPLSLADRQGPPDLPGPPDWPDLADGFLEPETPEPEIPEPPAWPDSSDIPEPPDCSEPPHWTVSPDGSEDVNGPNGPKDPGPPLHMDPWPDWASSSTAA